MWKGWRATRSTRRVAKSQGQGGRVNTVGEEASGGGFFSLEFDNWWPSNIEISRKDGPAILQALIECNAVNVGRNSPTTFLTRAQSKRGTLVERTMEHPYVEMW